MTEEQRQKRRAYAREYRKKNPERCRGYAKRYRERYPEKVRQSERAWREANREQLRRKKAARDAVRVDRRYWLLEPEGLAACAASLRWSGLKRELSQERVREFVADSLEADFANHAVVWFG